MSLASLVGLLATWWELWLVVAAGLAAATLAPLVIGRRASRPPTDAERSALEAVGVPPERVRVLTSRRVGALAAGLSPRLGRVFLTERLATELPPREFAAVARHEYGHLARGHVPLRLALPVGFATAWVAVSTLTTLSSFLVGVGLLVPTVVGSVVVGRWSESDADRFAARRAGGDRLAAALTRLARGGHLGDGGLLHPDLADRLARLTGSESAKVVSTGAVSDGDELSASASDGGGATAGDGPATTDD